MKRTYGKIPRVVFPLWWMIYKAEAMSNRGDFGVDNGEEEVFLVTCFYDTYPHSKFKNTPGWIGYKND